MGLPITTDADPEVSQVYYSFTQAEAVRQVFDGLKDPQIYDLIDYAEMNASWGRYAFLTPEETASLALCGFEVGDTHGR